jgi:hypothetical protein
MIESDRPSSVETSNIYGTSNRLNSNGKRWLNVELKCRSVAAPGIPVVPPPPIKFPPLVHFPVDWVAAPRRLNRFHWVASIHIGSNGRLGVDCESHALYCVFKSVLQ